MAIVLQEYNNPNTVKFDLVISCSWVAWLRSNAAVLDNNTVKVRAEGQHQGHLEEVELLVVRIPQ